MGDIPHIEYLVSSASFSVSCDIMRDNLFIVLVIGEADLVTLSNIDVVDVIVDTASEIHLIRFLVCHVHILNSHLNEYWKVT